MPPEEIRLRPRLQMAADMVRPGMVVADIGTDHAYLPAYLVQNNICPAAIGSDIGPGPLKNAAQTVEQFGLADKIKLLLSDGLNALPPGCASDLILAGMGGTLMARILRAVTWMQSPGIRLILQPMSHCEDVRLYLIQNGFTIRSENAVWDDHRPYLAICAEYTAEKQAYSPAYIYLGKLAQCAGSAASACIQKQAQRLSVRITSLQQAGRGEEEIAALAAALPEIRRTLEERKNDDRTEYI